jgi:hypothetical protein
VTNQFKNDPSTLADFGITLPARQIPNTATKSAAVQKRAATRQARHTMGTRQKANVKGTSPVAEMPNANAQAAAPPVAAATPPATVVPK